MGKFTVEELRGYYHVKSVLDYTMLDVCMLTKFGDYSRFSLTEMQIIWSFLNVILYGNPYEEKEVTVINLLVTPRGSHLFEREIEWVEGVGVSLDDFSVFVNAFIDVVAREVATDDAWERRNLADSGGDKTRSVEYNVYGLIGVVTDAIFLRENIKAYNESRSDEESFEKGVRNWVTTLLTSYVNYCNQYQKEVYKDLMAYYVNLYKITGLGCETYDRFNQ